MVHGSKRRLSHSLKPATPRLVEELVRVQSGPERQSYGRVSQWASTELIRSGRPPVISEVITWAPRASAALTGPGDWRSAAAGTW
jgi:hypothetical protein